MTRYTKVLTVVYALTYIAAITVAVMATLDLL